MVMMSDILTFAPRLDGILSETLAVRSVRIQLDRLEVMVDIGFHEFEVGTPQRLLVSVEVWLDPAALPLGDRADDAWNYDFLKLEIERLAGSGRFNLQERFASEVFNWIAARDGVQAVRVTTSKPDVYPSAKGVGVELASFAGPPPGGR